MPRCGYGKLKYCFTTKLLRGSRPTQHRRWHSLADDLTHHGEEERRPEQGKLRPQGRLGFPVSPLTLDLVEQPDLHLTSTERQREHGLTGLHPTPHTRHERTLSRRMNTRRVCIIKLHCTTPDTVESSREPHKTTKTEMIRDSQNKWSESLNSG